MKHDIQPFEYRFTFSEAAEVAGVSEMNLRNWMSRDVVKVGQKHKLGRWLFCPLDVIRLRVVGDLTTFASIPPAEANDIADLVVGRYLMMVVPDENGKTLITESKKEDFEFLDIVIYKDGKEVKNSSYWVKYNIKGNPYEGFDLPWLNRSHLVIPADKIADDVYMKLFSIADAEDGDWKFVKINGDRKADQHVETAADDILGRMKVLKQKFNETAKGLKSGFSDDEKRRLRSEMSAALENLREMERELSDGE